MTTIKLSSFNKLPIIKGKLNNKDAYFIVDCGATFSVLDINAVNTFNFGTMETDDEAVGYGGQANFQKVNGAEINVGGVTFNAEYNAQDLSPIVEVISQNEGLTINGIIGCNIIKRYGFIINYKDNTITF